MFKAALIGLVITLIGLAVAVLLRPVDRWGFRGLEPGRPDTVMGVIAIIISIAMLGLAIVVPSRDGAAPSSKFYLSGIALLVLSWGLTELGKAHIQKRRKR